MLFHAHLILKIGPYSLFFACAEATISIGNDWYSLVFITNVYIDMQKTADMIRPKNYTFEEISEELKAEVVASIKDE